MRSFGCLLPPAASFCWSVFPFSSNYVEMRLVHELAFCSRRELEPCLVPYLPQPASCGAPTRGFFWFHRSAKYSRLSFDAGCTKGPGGTETRMAATRPAIGSAGSHLLCSKASDTFFSAPRRQANRGAGKTFATESRRPSKMTESSPPQLGLFGDPQIPENEQGHIALASAHQLSLMRSNSCVPCVTHRSRWTY